MKLVIVVDVDLPATWAEEPDEVARGVLFLHDRAAWRFVRAEWEDTARREGADALVDDEDE